MTPNAETALNNIIKNEGRSLLLIAELMTDSILEQREVINQIYEQALKQLYRK